MACPVNVSFWTINSRNCTVNLLKFRNTLLDKLFDFLILGSAFIGSNISDLIKEFLRDSQGISWKIILHFDAPLTTY